MRQGNLTHGRRYSSATWLASTLKATPESFGIATLVVGPAPLPAHPTCKDHYLFGVRMSRPEWLLLEHVPRGSRRSAWLTKF